MKQQTARTIPLAARPYVAQLRLLVTAACSHRCPFCHNEGQDRHSRTMRAASLQRYLPLLRDFSPQITISGGEPLQSPDVDSIIADLAEHDFDITLVTAGAELLQHTKAVGSLDSLHVSIVSLRDGPLGRCNGEITDKLQALKTFRELYPLLKISVNVPFVAQTEQIEDLERFCDLAYTVSAKLNWIGEFSGHRSASLASRSWEARWGRLVTALQGRGFTKIDATGRDWEFGDKHGTVIQLSEIACASVDPTYQHGHCFDNMDVTIDHDLTVALCRWQAHRVSLERLHSRGQSLADGISELIDSDTQNCPYGIAPHNLSHSSETKPFIFKPQADWPIFCQEAVDRVGDLTRRREVSYAGRSGVVARFEREFAEYQESRFALALASGTASLAAAYEAIELVRGDEVIVPIYSYPGTVTPLLSRGVIVRFCDVSPHSGNIDVVSAASLITDRTKAVIATHMWGAPFDVIGLKSICDKHQLKLVEDCSHAIGAKVNGRSVGTFGDVACFSLQSNKSVSAGEGGVLVTNSRDVFDRATIFTTLRERILDTVLDERHRRYWETGTGIKLKIHPLGAAIALGHLHMVGHLNLERRVRADVTRAALQDCVDLIPPSEATGERVFYTYKALLVDDLIQERDAVTDRLIRSGIRARISDLKPLNTAPLFSEICKNGEWPGAQLYWRRTVTLPAFTFEPLALVSAYADALVRAVRLSESAAGMPREHGLS